MRNDYCEKEPEVLEMLRSGARNPELLNHAANCRACADVLIVSEFLQSEAQSASAEFALPEADSVWWKAQLFARRTALTRATRPIEFFRHFACVAGVLAFLWFLFGPSETRTWLVQMANRPFVERLWTESWFATVLLGATATFLFAVWGSFYMLLADDAH